MAIAHRPETFSALRARHEALRIAEAIIRGAGGGVDVDHVTCHACGIELDWRNPTSDVAIDCPSCGAVNELPCHLRYRAAPIPTNIEIAYASAEPDRRVWWNDVVPVARAVCAPVPPDQAAPLWLKVFCLTCLAIVLTSLALMAMSTHLH
jgi:hypothetical protein